MSTPKFEEAIKRLRFQAEIGGWYKEDSTVPVRIGDLYTIFDKLKEMREEVEDSRNSDECFNAVIRYILGKGYCEEPLEFLRCWNEGNFEVLREEWPDAPEEIYLADPLYKVSK